MFTLLDNLIKFLRGRAIPAHGCGEDVRVANDDGRVGKVRRRVEGTGVRQGSETTSDLTNNRDVGKLGVTRKEGEGRRIVEIKQRKASTHESAQ